LIKRRAALLAVVMTFLGATAAVATAPTPSQPVPAAAFTAVEPALVTSGVAVPDPSPARPAADLFLDRLGGAPLSPTSRPVVDQPGATVKTIAKITHAPARKPTAHKSAAHKSTARKAAPRHSRVVRVRSTGHHVGGRASWYCLPGTSACQFQHSGGMYAAAGGEIRIGNWRGRTVSVCGNGRCISVKLIDWCACGGPRIIDLYSDAFKRLAPLNSGVINVTVSW
jgi:hypothetical protein